eukprot:Rmarinus@m.2231
MVTFSSSLGLFARRRVVSRRFCSTVPAADVDLQWGGRSFPRASWSRVKTKVEEKNPNLPRIRYVLSRDEAKDAAQMLVEHARSPDFRFHAWDVETTLLKLSKISIRGNGQITAATCCMGENGDLIFINNMDDNLLQEFAAYFSDSSIRKVWHALTFDAVALANHGIFGTSCYLDTLEVARLTQLASPLDLTRRARQFSLKTLTSPGSVLLETLKNGQNRFEAAGDIQDMIENKTVNGSFFETFAVRKIYATGRHSVSRYLPPTQVLQQSEQFSPLFVKYATVDALSTHAVARAYEEVLHKLPWRFLRVGDLKENTFLSPVDVEHTHPSMFKFYQTLWKPYCQSLTDMELSGLAVSADELTSLSRDLYGALDAMLLVIRSWVRSRAGDAGVVFNIQSGAHKRSILFGEGEKVVRVELTLKNKDGAEEGSESDRWVSHLAIEGIGMPFPSEENKSPCTLEEAEAEWGYAFRKFGLNPSMRSTGSHSSFSEADIQGRLPIMNVQVHGDSRFAEDKQHVKLSSRKQYLALLVRRCQKDAQLFDDPEKRSFILECGQATEALLICQQIARLLRGPVDSIEESVERGDRVYPHIGPHPNNGHPRVKRPDIFRLERDLTLLSERLERFLNSEGPLIQTVFSEPLPPRTSLVTSFDELRKAIIGSWGTKTETSVRTSNSLATSLWQFIGILPRGLRGFVWDQSRQPPSSEDGLRKALQHLMARGKAEHGERLTYNHQCLEHSPLKRQQASGQTPRQGQGLAESTGSKPGPRRLVGTVICPTLTGANDSHALVQVGCETMGLHLMNSLFARDSEETLLQKALRLRDVLENTPGDQFALLCALADEKMPMDLFWMLVSSPEVELDFLFNLRRTSLDNLYPALYELLPWLKRVETRALREVLHSGELRTPLGRPLNMDCLQHALLPNAERRSLERESPPYPSYLWSLGLRAVHRSPSRAWMQASVGDVWLMILRRFHANQELRDSGFRVAAVHDNSVVLEGPSRYAEHALALAENAVAAPFDTPLLDFVPPVVASDLRGVRLPVRSVVHHWHSAGHSDALY